MGGCDIRGTVKGVFLLFLVNLYINHVMVDTVWHSCQCLGYIFSEQVVFELPFNIPRAYLCRKYTEEAEKHTVSMLYENTRAYFKAYCSKSSHAYAFDI